MKAERLTAEDMKAVAAVTPEDILRAQRRRGALDPYLRATPARLAPDAASDDSRIPPP